VRSDAEIGTLIVMWRFDGHISRLVACSLLVIVIWLVTVASPLVVSSQVSAPAALEQMAKLDFLVGEWKGTGWEINWDGSPAFQWIVHTPESMARTTIKVDEHGEWNETLEFLLSGGWFKVRETVLKKVK